MLISLALCIISIAYVPAEKVHHLPLRDHLNTDVMLPKNRKHFPSNAGLILVNRSSVLRKRTGKGWTGLAHPKLLPN